MLMWGVVYQGYNAVFPAFYQELFPTRTRVTGVRGLAEPGHHGHRVPAGGLRPGGAARVERAADRRDLACWSSASSAAIAAYTARETFRVHMNDLGVKDAQPVPREEYERLRADA